MADPSVTVDALSFDGQVAVVSLADDVTLGQLRLWREVTEAEETRRRGKNGLERAVGDA